jgi:hypothetical protein
MWSSKQTSEAGAEENTAAFNLKGAGGCLIEGEIGNPTRGSDWISLYVRFGSSASRNVGAYLLSLLEIYISTSSRSTERRYLE